MKYKLCVAAILSIVNFTSLAAMNKVVDEQRPIKTINFAKIYFTGAVTINKIMSLSSIIDEISQKYKATTEVQLYINSNGGDIDAGKIAYQIIKDSPIPVTTINMSSVESSATLIYCGANKRMVMNNSVFLLHAPRVQNAPEKSIGEDVLDERNEFNNRYRDLMKNIYKTCTNLTDEQIEKVTYSEDNHMLLDNKRALAVGIATGEISNFQPADVAYYINDKN